MKFGKNKQINIFLSLTIAWYLISFLIPYNTLANSLGVVSLGHGNSWPLSFFLMDIITIVITLLFLWLAIKEFKKKKLNIYWFLFAILLIYPLFTVWATLQDLIFNPIAP